MRKKIKQLKLGVVHGPNKGAYVPLADGVYSVGKSEKCDLILNDSLLNDHHIDIFLKDGDITISTMGSEVFVDGKPCVSFHRRLDHYDIITIGDSHITIGSEGTRWPTLIPPVSAIIESNQQSIANAEVNPDNDNINNTSAKLLLFSGRQRNTAQVAVSVLLISSVVLLVLVVGLVMPVQAVIKKNTVDDEIQNIIRQYELEDQVRMEYKDDGTQHLVGYVENQSILNNLITSVLSKNINMVISIKNTEELATQSSGILKSLGINHVSVQAEGSGQLMAKGYVVDKVDWEQAKELVIKDVTGVLTIDDIQIYTLDQIATELTEKIADKSLDRWVRIVTEDGSLKVIGKIPKHSRSEWQKIVDDFKKKYGGKIELSNKVTVTKKLNIILPLKSVSIGKTPYLTIDNNKKYLEGSMIGKEYTVQAIKADRIVIEDGSGNTFDYLIGEHGG